MAPENCPEQPYELNVPFEDLCDEIFDSENGLGPSQIGEDGEIERFAGEVITKMEWGFNWEAIDWGPANGDGYKCVISLSNLLISMDCVVVMPEWTQYDDGSEEEQEAWDSFIEGLRIHEAGHVDIAHEWKETIEETLLDEFGEASWTGSGPNDQEACQQAAAEMNQAIADRFSELMESYHEADDEYDSNTEHGRTQGAVLVCPSDEDDADDADDMADTADDTGDDA